MSRSDFWRLLEFPRLGRFSVDVLSSFGEVLYDLSRPPVSRLWEWLNGRAYQARYMQARNLPPFKSRVDYCRTRHNFVWHWRRIIRIVLYEYNLLRNVWRKYRKMRRLLKPTLKIKFDKLFVKSSSLLNASWESLVRSYQMECIPPSS